MEAITKNDSEFDPYNKDVKQLYGVKILHRQLLLLVFMTEV